MNTARTIALRSHGRYLTIELHERPYPNSETEWDRSAIRATIVAEAGVLKARIPTLVWDQDIANLLKTLGKINELPGPEASETATIGGYEPLLELVFTVNKGEA